MVSRDAETAHDVWRKLRAKRHRRLAFGALFFSLLLAVGVSWEHVRASL